MGIFAIVFMIAVVGIASGVLSTVVGSAFGGIPMIVVLVAIIVFGGVLREFAKNTKNLSRTSQKDLDEIKQRITQIEVDIADIKEQIADFIISQV